MNIPENQIEFLRGLRKGNDKPIIAVITGGSPMDLREVQELADAVLFAWYPGEAGGKAIADILFGNVSPSGRLPITFPMSVEQLPPYADYDMQNRTYRYMEGEPLYPFGYGLSYAQFEYGPVELEKTSMAAGESQKVSCTVKNTGSRAGREVVQLYVSDVEAAFPVPKQALKGVQALFLEPGEEQLVEFEITSKLLEQINKQGKPILEPGLFRIQIGGTSPGSANERLGVPQPVAVELTIK